MQQKRLGTSAMACTKTLTPDTIDTKPRTLQNGNKQPTTTATFNSQL